MDIGKTLEPGDTIRVFVNGKMKDRYVEDGPYFQDEIWVTVADDEGEISSAKWNKARAGWIEFD